MSHPTFFPPAPQYILVSISRVLWGLENIIPSKCLRFDVLNNILKSLSHTFTFRWAVPHSRPHIYFSISQVLEGRGQNCLPKYVRFGVLNNILNVQTPTSIARWAAPHFCHPPPPHQYIFVTIFRVVEDLQKIFCQEMLRLIKTLMRTPNPRNHETQLRLTRNERNWTNF